MDRYEIIIYWSEDDQAFVADVPELPGCLAHGSSHEDALRNAKEAMALWIETAFSAPYWVHLFTTLPFMLATCIPPLRPLKGWLINSQYYFKAEEGRIATPTENDQPLG